MQLSIIRGLMHSPVRWIAVLLTGLFLTLASAGWANAQTMTVPPDIRAIQAKMRAGEELTEDEEKRYEEWTDSLEEGQAKAEIKGNTPGLVKGNAPTAASNSLPCPATPPKATAMAAPSQADYITLVKALIQSYGARLGAGQAGLDVSLKKASAKGGLDEVGAVEMMWGAAGASVYSFAVMALAHPNDALAASNLGAALNSIPDARAASQALLYAAQLNPKLRFVPVNLGWVYYDAGQIAAARQWFGKAMGLDPMSPDSEAAEGFLAACRNDYANGERLLRQSLQKRYSEMAARALYQMQAKTAMLPGAKKVQAKPESPPPDTPKDTNPPKADDLAPEMPVSEVPEQTAESKADLEQLSRKMNERVSTLSQKRKELMAEIAKLNRHALAARGSIVFPLVYDQQLFQFGEVARMVFPDQMANAGARMLAAGNNMTRNLKSTAPVLKDNLDRMLKLQKEANAARLAGDEAKAGEIEEKMKPIEYKACIDARESAGYTYSQHFQAWQAAQTAIRETAPDFYAFTEPVLQRTYQPLVHELLENERDLLLETQYQNLARYAVDLSGMAGALKDFKCVPPKPPVPQPKAKAPSSKKSDPPPCPFEKGKLFVRLVVMSMELDCESVKIEGGEGLIGSVEKNFKTREVKIAVMAGAKAEAGFGMNEGGLKMGLETKVGIELTFDGDHVSDVAVKSSAAATASAGGEYSAELEARLGVMTGPTLSFSTQGSTPGEAPLGWKTN